MKSVIIITAIILSAISSAAGASQPPAPEYSRWSEISAATWPLAQANVELCGQAVAPSLGFNAGGSLNNQPLLLGVGQGSPAQLAGLQDFDELVSINGKKLKTRKMEKVLERYNEVFADEIEADKPVDVVYQRDGIEASASITPVQACNFTVIYVPKPIPSSTQGTAILQGNSIDAYAHTPEQIRAYLSRSFARIILDHQGQNAKQGKKFDLLNGAAGLLTGHKLGVTGNALARFRNAEGQDLEQDYLSVYLLARAGDDVSGITDFWQGVFANPAGNGPLGNGMIGRALGQSQGSPARIEELTAARDEVMAKQAAGEALIPAGRTAN